MATSNSIQWLFPVVEDSFYGILICKRMLFSLRALVLLRIALTISKFHAHRIFKCRWVIHWKISRRKYGLWRRKQLTLLVESTWILRALIIHFRLSILALIRIWLRMKVSTCPSAKFDTINTKFAWIIRNISSWLTLVTILDVKKVALSSESFFATHTEFTLSLSHRFPLTIWRWIKRSELTLTWCISINLGMIKFTFLSEFTLWHKGAWIMRKIAWLFSQKFSAVSFKWAGRFFIRVASWVHLL